MILSSWLLVGLVVGIRQFPCDFGVREISLPRAVVAGFG